MTLLTAIVLLGLILEDNDLLAAALRDNLALSLHTLENRGVDSTVSFDVLLVENNGDVKVGTPVVEGVKVEGKVEAQTRGEKIIVFKYKSKKNYRRKQGHRQPYTKVEITKIG